MRGLNFIPSSPIRRRKPSSVNGEAGEESSNSSRPKLPFFKGGSNSSSSKIDNRNTANACTNNTNDTSVTAIDWHKDISHAMRTGGWDQIRTHLKTVLSIPEAENSSNNCYNNNNSLSSLNASAASLGSSDMSILHASMGTFSSEESGGNHSQNGNTNRRSNKSARKKFWKLLSKKGKGQDKSSQTQNNTTAISDRTGLLSVDTDGRTPLHLALTTKRCPRDILLQIIALEPRAVAVTNSRGRYPLHFAVVHKHDMQVVSELIDTFPPALSACDCKDMEPLAYAMDAAKRESNIAQAPRTFWMPARDGSAEYNWQEEQCEIWRIVHWLLLAAATHPRTRLSLGRGRKSKPMLVDALIYAAPPPVVSLLIAASVSLLSYENRATAFAGSTLYSCIARHYPVQILMSLASQCPKDVHTVQDETGMGLVSSQFISGCFQQGSDHEWELCDDFHQKVLETIDKGVLDEDDNALLDWWQKIEFLLAFCDSGNKSDPSTFPCSQLLFAALKNVDTPPQVVEMLLALYPQSIRLKDQESGALPLYLAASRREYVPRKYERKAFEKKNILGIVLQCDQNAATRKFGQSLPIHRAASSGRTYPDLKPLVAQYPELLLEQDPSSGLYPFMQVAVTQNHRDLARWTCVARNKHSFLGWKEFSERQKASAVIKVAEKENLARLGTIYELLRLQPGVIEKMGRAEQDLFPTDEYAVGGVSSHFCSWYYAKSKAGKRIPNLNSIQMFRSTLQIVDAGGSFDDLPEEFIEWWNEMKRRIVSVYQLHGKEEWTIPVDDDKYLLHAAVSNSDTPPQVVELLLKLYPRSSSTPLPGVPFLPLHIAARTLAYRPRSFESFQKESFGLILNTYPEAAESKAAGYLPLHLALRGYKTWDEIQTLVEVNQNALSEQDPKSGFYPFQLIAMKKSYNAMELSWFENAAKNQFEEQAWELLSSREKFREKRLCQRSHQLEVLSCTFELLRKNVSVLPFSALKNGENSCAFSSEPEKQQEKDDSECDDADSEVDESATSGSYSCSSSYSDSSSDGSFHRLVNMSSSHRISQKEQENGKELSLDHLFSKKSRSCNDEENDDLFECDASVLSNVDVMSTLSMTIDSTINRHSTQKRNKRSDSRKSLHREDSRRGLREFAHKASSNHEISCGKSRDRISIRRGYSSNRELLRRDDSCRELLERTGSVRELFKEGGSLRDLFQKAGSQRELLQQSGSQLGGSQRDLLQRNASQQELQRGGSIRELQGNSSLRNIFESMPLGESKQDGSDETEYDEFAEDLVIPEDTEIPEETEYQNDFAEDTNSGEIESISHDEETNSLEQNPSDHNPISGAHLTEYNDNDGDEDELITFLMRRIPRIKSKQERDSIAAVRLCRRRPSLDSFSTTSTARKKTTISSATQRSLKVSVHSTGSTALWGSSLHSDSTTDSGYKSLNSQEREKLSGATGMVWVGDAMFKQQNNLLGSMDHSEPESDSERDIFGEEPAKTEGPSNDVVNSDHSFSLDDPSEGSDTLQSSLASTTCERKEEHVTKQVHKVLEKKSTQIAFVPPIKSLGPGKGCANKSVSPGISDYFHKREDVMPEDSDFSNAPSTLSYLQDGHSISGNLEKSSKASASASASPVATEQKYFDKTAMKWRRKLTNLEERSELLEKAVELTAEMETKTKTTIHPMYFCKEEWAWKKRESKRERPSQGQRRTPQVEPLNYPRMGMPFVDFISREDIKRRNRLAVDKLESPVKTKKATEEAPFVANPGETTFRSAWKSVLDGKTEHFCCLLCQKNAREVLMVPCRHLAICRHCSNKQKNLSACPLCNTITSDRMLIC